MAPARRTVGFGFVTVVAIVSSLPLAGCSVDDRILKRSKDTSSISGAGLDQGSGAGSNRGASDGATPTDDPDATTPPNGSGGHTGVGGHAGNGGVGGQLGTGGLADTGGAGGVGGAPPETGGTPGCAPGSGVEGCDKTLTKNSTFGTDASSWVAEPEVAEAWGTPDTTGSPGSGSLSVKDSAFIDVSGTGTAGSTQCIVVLPDTTYVFAANAFLPDGQEAGNGAVAAWTYDSPACAGKVDWVGNSTYVGTPGQWATAVGSIHTTPTTQSMLVRLIAVKPFKAHSLEVLFDDVRVYVP